MTCGEFASQEWTTLMTKATKHFKNCLGVFQGGGCKALAFVGAFREAISRGVFFSSVAGTSAGSIIAALIAAGAEPEDLESLISNTDFNRFKRPAKSNIGAKNPGIAGRVLGLGSEKHRTIAKFMTHLGLFSSEELETWLEQTLQSLLGKSERVRFRDLNIPLSVVATELGAEKPIVWSYDKTPDEFVSFAVRCSCSIPIFFQPVQGKYVDGGIVSNLPTFALSDEQNRGYEKLLCFTFSNGTTTANSQSSEDQTKKVEISLKDYFSKLVSSIIDSAVTIQTDLQQDLHIIEIGDLCLDTVDFDKIDASTIQKMHNSGRLAAQAFFDDEIHNVKPATNSRRILITEPETLNQVVRSDLHLTDEIIISLRDTRYVYNLYPTLLNWSLRKLRIQFYTISIDSFTGKELQHEKLRRLVLKGLGVEVVESSELEFETFLFCKNSTPHSAFVLSPERKEDKKSYFAVQYNKTFDLIVLEWLKASLLQLNTNNSKPTPASITFSEAGYDTLIERLKTIEQYSPSEVKFSMAEIPVKDLVFLTKYVKSYKYNQISRLFDIYDSNALELFGAVQIEYKGSDSAITMPITPPVVEEIGGKYYIIEGNSRLTYMIRERKLSSVKVIVAKNVAAPLPSSKKFTAKQILISDDDKKGADRFEDFDYRLYRKIEESVRTPAIYCKETI